MLYGHRIVAVCISKLTEEIQRQFIEALTETLRPHGWNVIVFMTGTRERNPHRQIFTARQK